MCTAPAPPAGGAGPSAPSVRLSAAPAGRRPVRRPVLLAECDPRCGLVAGYQRGDGDVAEGPLGLAGVQVPAQAAAVGRRNLPGGCSPSGYTRDIRELQTAVDRQLNRPAPPARTVAARRLSVVPGEAAHAG